MLQSVGPWLLPFAALTLAMGLATPAQSQVIVDSFPSTNSSGFHPPQRNVATTRVVKVKVARIHPRHVHVESLRPLFSWEDIQEFQIAHLKNWEKWYAMYRLRH